MFDLEPSIVNWRRQMADAGVKTPAPLEELEIHLRDEIDRQLQAGLDEPAAFNLGVQSIGKAHELRAEFTKINKMECKCYMKNSQIVRNLSMSVVLLAAAWLVFSASMIGKDLFPKDGLVSMRASDGATIQVQEGVPMLMSPGVISNGDQYHFALIPALAIPFAILVAFAIIGCRSLSQKQTPLTAQPQGQSV